MNEIFRDEILNGKIAFVTGGGTGITGGVGRALAEAGAHVALVSRSLEHLEPAAKAINAIRAERAGMPALPGEAFAVAADVRDPEEVQRAIAATIERFGKIDIVVNGAAGNFLCSEGNLQRLPRRIPTTERSPRSNSQHQRDAALSRHADAASRVSRQGRRRCADSQSRG